MALADWAARFYTPIQPNPEELAKHVVEGVRPAVGMLAKMLEACPWDKAAIGEAIKEVLRATGMKMPQLAMPVRVLVMGTRADAVARCGAGIVRARNSAGAAAGGLKKIRAIIQGSEIDGLPHGWRRK